MAEVNTADECPHPENRRAFDTGIEWCLDCQSVMDEKGNFIPYHLTNRGTTKCPHCPRDYPHQHSIDRKGFVHG